MRFDELLKSRVNVINLDNFIDRYAATKSNLSKVGFTNVRRYDAFKGRISRIDLNKNKDYAEQIYKQYDLKLHNLFTSKNELLHSGDLGCFMSQYLLLLENKDNDYVIIAEDDCLPNEHFKNLERFWNQTQDMIKDFDFICFNCDARTKSEISYGLKIIKQCDYDNNMLLCSRPTFSSHFQIISKKGINKLLDIIKKDGISCIDIIYKQNWNKLKAYNYIYTARSKYCKIYNHITQYVMIGQDTRCELSRDNYEENRDDYFGGIHGWCCKEKEKDIFYYLDRFNCKKGLEIGVFGGSSLVRLGYMFKANNGFIIGIDPYEASYSNQYDEKGSVNYEWWKEINYKDIHEHALENIKKYNLEKHIGLLKIDSQTFSKYVSFEELDFIHIDGNHTIEQALKDLIQYLPKLKDGSLIFFDDIGWDSLQHLHNILSDILYKVKEYNDGNGVSYGIYIKKPKRILNIFNSIEDVNNFDKEYYNNIDITTDLIDEFNNNIITSNNKETLPNINNETHNPVFVEFVEDYKIIEEEPKLEEQPKLEETHQEIILNFAPQKRKRYNKKGKYTK